MSAPESSQLSLKCAELLFPLPHAFENPSSDDYEDYKEELLVSLNLKLCAYCIFI